MVLFLTLTAAAQDVDQLASRAARAREANRVEEAVALYRQALSLHPRWGEGWFYLATLLYDRDAYAEASEAFKKTTDLNPQIGTAWAELRPQLPLGHYLLGSALLETGQTARAIAELETAQRSAPDEAKIYFALGRAYARAGRQQEAERARATFTRLNKDHE